MSSCPYVANRNVDENIGRGLRSKRRLVWPALPHSQQPSQDASKGEFWAEEMLHDNNCQEATLLGSNGILDIHLAITVNIKNY